MNKKRPFIPYFTGTSVILSSSSIISGTLPLVLLCADSLSFVDYCIFFLSRRLLVYSRILGLVAALALRLNTSLDIYLVHYIRLIRALHCSPVDFVFTSLHFWAVKIKLINYIEHGITEIDL